METLIHILHLEDDPSDAELIQAMVEEERLPCRITLARAREEYDDALRQNGLDIILADFKLPMYDGMSALRLAKKLRPDVPFIFVSGTMGEEAAIEGLTQGATDYVLKHNLSRLPSAIRRALSEARNRKERQQAERALAESENKMRSIVDNIGVGVALISPKMEVLEMNRRMLQWFPGADPSQHPICYKTFNTPPLRDICSNCPACKTLQDGVVHEATTRRPQDDMIRNYRVVSTPLFDADGKVIAAIEMVDDITERLRDERALQQSNEMLRAIIEAAPVAIIGLDLDGYVHSVWNPAAEKMLGWSAADVMGRSLSSVSEDRQEEFRGFQEQIRKGRTLKGVEVRRRRRDGTPIDYSIYASPLRDADGRISGNITVLVDITKRKQAEAALRTSEARYVDLYENAPDMYASINAQTGIIEKCNQTLADKLGRPKEEIIGRSVLDIYHPDCVDQANATFQEFIDCGTIQDRELQLRKTDGSKLEVSMNASAVRAEDGTILFSRSTLRDITERKRLEEHLRQVQKMEAIGQLAGGIAHDFNNILSAITGYTELSQSIIEPESTVSEYLAQVLEAGRRAKDLIDQILMFSRETAQQLRPIRVSFPVKEALKLIRASVPAPIEIRSRILSRASAMCDPTQIHQIVMNLCANAAHAMREKGGLLEVSLTDITIGPADDRKNYPDAGPGDYIQLTVADQGYGIDAQYIHRIFDPFFTTKKIGEGTGMGLSVVHGIVKSYGGFIYVHSRLGEGSTFEILIPAQECAVTSDAIQDTPIPTGSESILFVDDETMIVDIVTKMLESLGYRVVARTSAEEALEAFRSNPDGFDLVVTDMAMPKMSGLDLAEEILRIRPDFPIVLCTGFDVNMNEEKIAEHGLRGIVYKPILRRDIATGVRNALDSDRSTRNHNDKK